MTENESWVDRCNTADADEWKTIARTTIDKWTELDALSTEVIRAAHHGDQHLISCLLGDDPRLVRLRRAIVKLADWLQKNA